jgi:formamidopyrimidine-DNA glycosylase
MPELPEVECVRRSLERLAVGARVAGVDVRRTDIIARATTTPTAGRARVRPLGGSARRIPHAELLEGCVITALLRRGKQLALVGERDGERRALMVHLGMTGGFIHAPRGAPLPENDHVHVVWRLACPASAPEWTLRVGFRDPRRFGGLTTFPGVEALLEHWSHIGPDALKVTGRQLAAGAGESRRAIKAVLLDQRALAGVGNIYADEALFGAGIDPRTRAGDLDASALDLLAASVRSVLAEAVRAGGSTVRSYADADGAKGTAQQAHRVYGRAGRSCVRCGAHLAGGRVSQRATVWCPVCQPLARRRGPRSRLSTGSGGAS